MLAQIKCHITSGIFSMILINTRLVWTYLLTAILAVSFVSTVQARNWNTTGDADVSSSGEKPVEVKPVAPEPIKGKKLSSERKIIQNKPQAKAEKKFQATRVETKEVLPQSARVDSSNPIFKLIQAGRIDGVRFKSINDLQDVYADHDYEPIFLTRNRKAQSKANEYYEAILDSWSHGLNPSRYHSKALFEFLSTDRDSLTDEDILKADVILTDAIIRIGQDLTGSRIIPKKLGYHAPSINKGVLATEVVEFVRRKGNPDKAIKSLAPRGVLYQQMRDELMRLYQIPSGTTDKIRISGLIKPRTYNSAIPKIRARMGSPSDNLVDSENFYDDELASYIMAFQRANGLKDDGIIGPSTIGIMNLSNEDKIKKLIVNMERIRWEDQLKPDRYIMVNVPNETLWAVNNGRTEIQMKVVVGRPKRATKIFNTEITGVRVNPTWTIPPTIKKEDFATKLREDAAYLDNRGIKLYQGGQRVASSEIDWTMVADGELGQFRMVQGPSSSNPLGRYRVIMDNPYNIYLHDTPKKQYFARANRALSSGCIRMEDAEQVVDFILRTNPEWTEKRKQDLLERGNMTVVSAGESLPVYLQYKTVWIGEDNGLIYGNDIYKEDSNLFNALKKQGDIFTPEDINI